MDDKMKELIAIGASVAAHCQPCLTYHVEKAAEIGVSEDAIRDAIAVGQMVERGAAAAMKKFALNVFDTPQNNSSCCADGNSKGSSCCA